MKMQKRSEALVRSSHVYFYIMVLPYLIAFEHFQNVLQFAVRQIHYCLRNALSHFAKLHYFFIIDTSQLPYDQATLFLNIQDVNDNSPHFIKSNYIAGQLMH